MATVFMFESLPVGSLEERDYPRTPGQYRYMPFRGPGHYKMQTLLRKGGRPRCHYNDGKNVISFTVQGCPKYGVLDLCEFQVG